MKVSRFDVPRIDIRRLSSIVAHASTGSRADTTLQPLARPLLPLPAGHPPFNMAKRKKQLQGKRPSKTKRLWIERVDETPPLDDGNDHPAKFILKISRSILSDNQTFGPFHQRATASVKNEPTEETASSKPAVMAPYAKPSASKKAWRVIFDHSMQQEPLKYDNSSFRHLPNGDCGDGIVNPHPRLIQDKYWAQRKRFFSRFDEGIQMDSEGWYSVTPEVIAHHTAARMCDGGESMVVFDLCAGVGGNTIAIALHPNVSLVVAIEKSRERLDMVAHNARVYDVPDQRVRFIQADVFDVLQLYRHGKRNDKATNNEEFKKLPDRVDAMFASPPWGGPKYTTASVAVPLSAMLLSDGNRTCKDLVTQVVEALGDKPNCSFFLPKNVDGANVGKVLREAGLPACELEQNYITTKMKAVTLYTRT